MRHKPESEVLEELPIREPMGKRRQLEELAAKRAESVEPIDVYEFVVERGGKKTMEKLGLTQLDEYYKAGIKVVPVRKLDENGRIVLDKKL